MKRFYEPLLLNKEVGDCINLSARNFHYMKHVLRMASGTEVELFDGQGKSFNCTIESIDKKTIDVSIDSQINTDDIESPLNTHLGLVISKGDRFDYAIQKATELGVSQITPLTSTFCDVKLNSQRQDKKLQHWSDTIISACEQSGRTHIPELHPITALSEWSASVIADKKWVFHTQVERQQSLTQEQGINSLALLIGPEGGLHADEVVSANTHGFMALQLGPRVLRTETAPIAALTLAQLKYGDF